MLSALLGLLIFSSDDATSATVIFESTITSDDTWNLSNSPYYIEGNVTLAYGVNLTIEPGVEVRFNGSYSLYIGGNLTAVGNASDMITFTSNSISPGPGNWSSIQVNSTGHVTMRYCDIRYGDIGIEILGSSENDIRFNRISNNDDKGIRLEQSSNNYIANNNISNNFDWGIFLSTSSGNDIRNNTVSNNMWHGVDLYRSQDNTIHNNTINDNFRGIFMSGSSGDESEYNNISLNHIYSNGEGIRMLSFAQKNNITGNNISENWNYGAYLSGNSNNLIYHNIFWNNTNQAYNDTPNNFWDDGYPSGGNYWSDFDEPGEGAYDNLTGPNQNEGGSDGIVDDPYINIIGGAVDNFPLIKPSIDRTFVYLVSPKNNSFVVSSTILDFIVVGEDIVQVNYSLDGGLTNWTLSPPWDIDTTGWSDGPYMIEFFVYDSQGGITGFWFNITIDATMPEIILNSPPNGSLIINGVDINITVLDDNLVIVNYTVNGGANTTLVAPYNIDTVAWPDGNYTIQVYASDMAHNLNSTIYDFAIDGSAPSILLLDPVNNSFIKNGTFMRFDITDAHLNTSTVNYSVNGAGPQTFLTPYEINITNWSDGNYIIEVNATDILGSAATRFFIITLDSVLPSISLVSPMNNSELRVGEILDFEIEDDNLDVVNYTINFGPNFLLIPPYDIDATSWSDGLYRIDITATDLAGNTNSSFYNLQIDTIPELILILPQNNSLVKTGTIIDISIVDLNLDHANYSVNGGPLIIFWPPYDISTSTWSDGNYTIEIHAISELGNTNSSWYNFTFDGTLPSIALNSPSNNSVIPSGTNLDFEVSDTYLLSVNYSINGGPLLPFSTPYDLYTGGWGDGNYSIIIVASDVVGNENISEFLFTLDSTAPIIQLLSPQNGTSTEIGTPIIFSIIEDNLDFVNYSVNLGVNRTLAFPNNINTSTWLDGHYTIVVFAVDLADNYNITWYEFTLNDTLNPMIVLNSPSNQSLIRAGVVIDFDIIDLNLRHVNYSLDNGTVISLDFPFNVTTVDWSEGLHTLTVYADDIYNHTNSSLFVFTFDSVSPSILLLSPLNNSVILPGVVLDFDIVDAHLDSVNYSMDQEFFSIFPSPFNIGTLGLGDGTHIVTIQANDLAGNENSATFRFIIDSTPPVIVLNSPANGSFILPGTIIDFTVSDANLDTVEYRIDNGSWDTLASPYDVNTTGLADGSHVMEIHARDAAGSGIYTSFYFTLDSTQPEVSYVTVVEPYYPYNNTQIIISFTEPMNIESVESALNITPDLNYTVTWYDDDLMVILKNIEGMQLSGHYFVHLDDGVEDLAGNPLVNFSGYGFLATIDIYLDTDEDGMSDGWEFLYDLDPYDPSDAEGDADWDGHTNLEEFEGGSDPTDPDSIPLKPEEEPSAFDYWWLVPILAALLIMTIVLFFLLMKGEGKEEPKGPEEEMEDLYLRMRAEEDIKAMESILGDKEKIGEGLHEAEIVVQKAKEAFGNGDYNLVTVYEKTLRDIVGRDMEEGGGEDMVEDTGDR